MFSPSPPSNYTAETPPPAEFVASPFTGCGCHNLQRKAALVHAGPVNHQKNVFLVSQKGFDLNKTIFKPVSGIFGLKRLIIKAKLANDLLWDEEASKKIIEEFEAFNKENPGDMKLMKQVEWGNDAEILDFMQNECDFKTEHADGSFMDHLYFCRDYSAAHYKQQSPRVLFLHSILGVGTNIFPMHASKEDKLRSLLTPVEFKQIEAFPTILRLINQKKLTDEIMNRFHLGGPEELQKMKEIKIHRVLDNSEISLTKDELFVALNYQIIHQLDFLPSTNWSTEVNDPLFQVFIELYDMLHQTKLLDANVKLSMDELKCLNSKDEFGMPLTLGGMISKRVPAKLKRQQLIKSVENFSKAIGHDLKYEITWEK